MRIPRKQRLAAEKGLAFLEDKYPGCIDRFNLETLDMSHKHRCALTQASGMRYDVAVSQCRLSQQELTKYGFESDTLTLRGEWTQYDRLTVAYKELIIERRAA